jgi:hypothetical protein
VSLFNAPFVVVVVDDVVLLILASERKDDVVVNEIALRRCMRLVEPAAT